MAFNFKKTKHYAYCGDGQQTIFAEIYRPKTGSPGMRLLGSDKSRNSCDSETVDLILNQASPVPGKVAIALPLHFFEVLSIQLPKMPDEAVSKALPYNLAKQVSKPLNEYLYDWQITKRKKEHLVITVYLFPRELYQPLAENFTKKKLKLTYLEADVFAAFAFLEKKGSLVIDEAALLTIIWPDSVSFAVWNNDILVLTRSMDIKQPEHQGPATNGIVATDAIEPEDLPAKEIETGPEHPEIEMAFEVEEKESEIKAPYNQGDSLLAGFDILAPSSTPHQKESMSPEAMEENNLILELEEPSREETAKPEVIEAPPIETPAPLTAYEDKVWDDYLANIGLEILRTRDYYTTIVKGHPIKSYFILGAEDFFPELEEYLGRSLGEKPRLIVENSDDQECSPALSVLGLGTGARW